MGEEHAHPAAHDATEASRARWRLILAVLAFLVTLLAALALTYGWGALTSAANVANVAPTLPFAARAAFSAVLVFLGAFALTSLWLPPLARAAPVAEASAPQAPASEVPAPPILASLPESDRDGKTPDAEPVPAHVPVRAADLPRILFDTNELPAITARQKPTTSPPRRHIFPPVAEPPQPDSPQPDSQE